MNSRRYHFFFLNTDLSSRSPRCSHKDIEAFLSEFDCVFCRGVRRGRYLNYCRVVDEAVAYELYCVS